MFGKEKAAATDHSPPRDVFFTAHTHSDRMLKLGDTLAARNAGTAHAATAVTNRNSVTETKVSVSVGVIPYKRLAIPRLNTVASKRPTAAPAAAGFNPFHKTAVRI